MKDAKYVGIAKKEDQITFEPIINGGATGAGRGYSYFENKNVTIDSNSTAEEIGLTLQACWGKCQ
ncbi:MAG: hypothetical protein AAFX87_27115 [Bacteroidota bacterium]